MKEANFKDFMTLDIRVGKVVDAKVFEEAKKPAYQIWVDFGEELGILKSSAQVTELYNFEDLIDQQVLGVVNFPDMQIANFMSEFLILGLYTEEGVVLIQPERDVDPGSKLG